MPRTPKAAAQHEVHQGRSSSDPYIHPHRAIRRRGHCTEAHKAELDLNPPEPVPCDDGGIFADGHELPRTLKIGPEQKKQDEQNPILAGMVKQLSIHSDRPTNREPRPVSPRPKPEPWPQRPQSRQTSPTWDFGRGNITDRPGNMAQSVLMRNHQDGHSSERNCRNGASGSKQLKQLTRQFSRHAMSLDWRYRTPPVSLTDREPLSESRASPLPSPPASSPNLASPPSLQAAPSHRASPSTRVSPTRGEGITTGRVSKRRQSPQKC